MAKKKVKYPYFDNSLKVENLIDNRDKTLEAFTWHRSETESHTVCKGFFTDKFSIPWWWRWRLPKSQPGNIVAVLHDMLCEKQYLPSKEVHRIFREAMESFDHRGRKLIVRHKWEMATAVKIGGPRWKELKQRPDWA